MELTEKLLSELQRRLKIGNRRGVHLNAIPANSRYKFDLNRLSHIDKDLPNNFINPERRGFVKQNIHLKKGDLF